MGKGDVRVPPEVVWDEDGTTLHCGDYRDVLPGLPEATFDLVLADPPYGIRKGSAHVREHTTVVDDFYDAAWNAAVDWDVWLPMAVRLLRPGGYLVAFHDMTQIVETYARFARSGLQEWRRYFLVKQAPPPTPRPGFASAVEEAVIGFRLGGPRGWWGGGWTPNRWYGMTPGRLRNGSGHPAEKPLDAVRGLVGALTPPGGRVLDPFSGSGTTLVAAHQTGRSAVGVELGRDNCALAITRLRQRSLFVADPPTVAEDRTLFD